ncbi:hypothetical protein M3661_16915 [Paenibacillus sp. MER 180]|uniref:hypothetical protein n=1 Tax=Paenibacillus sp. MER 180 TaxID=2939570 RepID=UPI00203E6948|nr:hypothetical protein [Paenibacillus sp. MER 180]MCM3291813.1 hypothetical protein [Paenibacillus sp. MER 180]
MMIEIGLVIAIAMSVGAWLKTVNWFPNNMIPLAIVTLAVAFNLVNAMLFHGDYLEAFRLAFIEAVGAIGIHSGTKNTFKGGEKDV